MAETNDSDLVTRFLGTQSCAPQVGVPERIDCRRCEGSGHGEQLSADHFARCPDCHGDGAQRCDHCPNTPAELAAVDLGKCEAICEDCAKRLVRLIKRDRARDVEEDDETWRKNDEFLALVKAVA
jgi:hypothetical protein